MPRGKAGKKQVKPAQNESVQKGIVQRLQKQGKVKKAVGSVIPMLGGLAGSYLGGPAGGAVGLAAGKLIASITGYGDYKINSNTVSNGNSVPSFRQGADGVRVCHREFIENITGSTTFSLRSFPINPGMSQTFPWLSLMGSHFEEYEMNGLVLEYRSSSGAAISTTSSALGVVIMATDYDAANASFVSKQQMESYEYSTSTVPFQGCLHPVECARRRNVLDSLYLRTTTPPTSTDIRLYDMGNFQYATEGMQSSYVVGELWVSYDCSFRKPRIPIASPLADLPFYAHFQENPPAMSFPGSFFGSAGGTLKSDSNMTSDDVVCTPTSIIIKKPGTYVTTEIVTGGTVSSHFTFTAGTNLSWVNHFVDDAASAADIIASPYGMSTRYLSVSTAGTGAANTLSIDYDAYGSETTTVDLLLFKVTSSPALTTSLSSTSLSSVSSSSWVDCKSDSKCN